MDENTTYLFLELGFLSYIVAFTLDHWDLRDLASGEFWRPAAFLFGLWTVIDIAAVRLGLWRFTEGTMPYRILGLPVEEYLLFLLHTVGCYALVERYWRSQ